MTRIHSETFRRAMAKLGLVHLNGGWVKPEDATRLQPKIDRAVEAVADRVAAVRGEKE